MPGRFRIQLLGGLRVEQAGRVITRFQTQQTGALLAYLAFHRDQCHPRDLLGEILWPEDHPNVARRKLRIALYSLRSQLEPHGVPAGSFFIAGRHWLHLDPRGYTTDVMEFEQSLEAVARAGSSLERIRLLEHAVELHRGELLPGYFEEWILPERLRLAERYLEALRQLVSQLEQTGDLTRALHWARQAVEADPLREESHHDLMRLLVASGHPEAAARAYGRLEQLLRDELGRAPNPTSRKLAGITGISASPPAPQVECAPQLPGRERLDPPFNQNPYTPPAGGSSIPMGLPTGTITLLLAEIEGAADRPSQAKGPAARVESQELLRQVVQRHGGHEVRAGGDALLIAFTRAADALRAAIAGQRVAGGGRCSAVDDNGTSPSETDSHPPVSETTLRVRMGLHTGDVELREGQYHGPILHHLTRVASAAHGGQILVSEATAAVLRPNLGEDLPLRDLGLFRLRPGAPPERLFEARPPDSEQAPLPPPNAPRAHQGYLPAQITRLFGREAEIAELRKWLLSGETRLVTLTGPAGVGKTRLAMATAAELQEPFDGAVWFMPLVDLADARLLVDRMLDLLRLPRTPGAEPLESVIEALSRQRTLLVVDNFEHLIDEGVAVLQTLLERAPPLSCLVTSRRRLDFYGEREYSVRPLPVPAEISGSAVESPAETDRTALSARNPQLSTLTACASVQLFVDRTQAVRPDFNLTATNAAVVAELCRRLEGIPLALELAAARAQVLPPAQVLAQLEYRFELLASRRRGLPARHQTLRAALDWSYQLLSPELQRFFTCLSVFRGGWTVDAAKAVCEGPDALDSMVQLREHSLTIAEEPEVQGAVGGGASWEKTRANANGDLIPGPERPTGEIRFRMLETVREYASEQLASSERERAERAHAEYFLRVAERAEPGLAGPDQLEWLARLSAEEENLRAALGWGLRHAGDPREARDGDKQSLPSADPAELGLRLGAALGKYWQVRGQLGEGRRWLEQLLSRQHTAPALRARALAALGVLARDQGKFDEARSRLVEALAVDRQVRAKARIAEVLCELAALIAVQNEGDRAQSPRDWAQAQVLLEESLLLWRELNEPRGLARALHQLGRLALVTGEYERARTLNVESLALWREVGDRRAIAAALNSLGLMARAKREYEAAAELYRESLVLYRELGDKRGINIAVHNLGDVASDQGDYARAFALEEQALELSRELGHRHWEAANLYVLGKLALKLAVFDRAGQLVRESLLALGAESNGQHCKDCFEALAQVAAARSEWERAVRLYAQAQAIRDLLANPMPAEGQARRSRDLAAARAALGDDGFQTAWDAGLALTIGEAIRFALS